MKEKAQRRFGPAETPADRRRRALDAVLRKADMTPTDVARAAGFSANTLHNFRNGISASLSQKTLEKMAQVIPGATIADLMGTATNADTGLTRAVVRSYAKLGEWRDQFDLPLKQQYEAPIQLSPFPRTSSGAG